MTKFSVYFSLAQTHNLTSLKNTLEKSFISSFKFVSLDDFLLIADHFDLENAKRKFEKKLVSKIQKELYYWQCNSWMKYMLLAEIYQYESLKEDLVKYCSSPSRVALLRGHKNFQDLSDDTKWRIHKRAISTSLQEKELSWWIVKSICVLDEVYDELFKTRPELLLSSPLPLESWLTDITILDQSTNPFTENSNTDVVVKVENRSLHLHSSVLSQCSPVFRVMLQGSSFIESQTKEIFLANRKALDVIEFFEFFYTRMRKEFECEISLHFFHIWFFYVV